MNQVSIDKNKGDVWFVYDGDCPICQVAAHGLRIKKAVGNLHLLNARKENANPIITEINNKGLNLDEGMVIKFNDVFYHGADALQIMALLGTNQGWFNRMNYLLFKSPILSKICYPPLRVARNFTLKLKAIQNINNLLDKNKPIFKPIFGKSWETLPPVMHKHYANRPYSFDIATVKGNLDVMCKWYVQPFFRVLGTVPPYNEKNVPVTVNFTSQLETAGFGFERIFNFKNRQPVHFHSRMYQVKGNEVMECMNYGICWHSYYSWDGNKVTLRHKSYSLRVLDFNIPLPITWLVGRADADEIPVSDNTFAMCATITHPLFGKIYEYKGQFKVTKEI